MSGHTGFLWLDRNGARHGRYGFRFYLINRTKTKNATTQKFKSIFRCFDSIRCAFEWDVVIFIFSTINKLKKKWKRWFHIDTVLLLRHFAVGRLWFRETLTLCSLTVPGPGHKLFFGSPKQKPSMPPSPRKKTETMGTVCIWLWLMRWQTMPMGNKQCSTYCGHSRYWMQNYRNIVVECMTLPYRRG